jgi:glycosyltransferase involved in cell wall biosynthesis
MRSTPRAVAEQPRMQTINRGLEVGISGESGPGAARDPGGPCCGPINDVAVVVSTRNRPAGIVKTVHSIIESCEPSPTVIVVDQSDDDLTKEALKEVQGQERIRYIRATSRGLAAGRNEGIRAADSTFIAMTDDDCDVPVGWLANLLNAFAADERIGIVFGNVVASPHDKDIGFVPAYHRTEPFLATNILDAHHLEGMGANFCIRKSTWEALNGFDVAFGAGARFGSAEELDFRLRALAKGHAVYETPLATVTHSGFRTWKEGDALFRGYLYGIGAAMAKQIRLRNWGAIALIVALAHRWAFGGPVVDLGIRKPSRLLRINAFLKGCWQGSTYPLDRAKGHFKLPADTARQRECISVP